jgi:hypothetical protein
MNPAETEPGNSFEEKEIHLTPEAKEIQFL